ncbi:glutaminyl-peptide cyclotransferase [Rhodococcus aerolatus]
MPRHRPLPVLAALLATVVLAGCGSGPSQAQPAPASTTAPGVEHLRPDVLATTPHDPQAFTQGFELDGGVLFEGTGLEGRSSVRRTDPATGAVTAQVALDPSLFGEGLTLAGDSLWQITWQDHVAFRRDPVTLAETGRASYEGEGWGLCTQADAPGGPRLVMSDGTDRLTFRDPTTFAATGGVAVTLAGAPLREINELECVDGQVWANVWQTDSIVRIDPTSGDVTAVVDATGLLPTDQRRGADVLNGIAAVPGTDRFLLTGKLWPTTFEVRFVPA